MCRVTVIITVNFESEEKMHNEKFTLLINICSLILLSSVVIKAQWVQTNGPYGGEVYSLLANGSDLYAGTNFPYDVFFSSNNGENWQKLTASGLGGKLVQCFALSGGNLFAGTASYGVYLSTDGGESWAVVNNGITNYNNVACLFVNGAYIYVGIGGGPVGGLGPGGVFLSTNNGTNWSEIDSGLTNKIVTSITAVGKDLFTGTWGGGVFRSTNNGMTWSAVDSGLSAKNIASFAMSGSNLYAGTAGNGVFLSTNEGVSWTSVSVGFIANQYVTSLVVMGSKIFAGTLNSGVFISINNGTDWNQSIAGMTNIQVESLAVSDSNVFAGTDGGVFVSNNSGENWTKAITGMNAVRVGALATVGSNLFDGTSIDGIFRSADNGTTWTQVDTGFATAVVTSFAVCPTGIFAGTNGGGIIRSTNNGISWNQVNMGLTTPLIWSLAAEPNDSGGSNIFVGVGVPVVYSGGSYGSYDTAHVFLSTNNGASWTPTIDSGLGSAANIYSLAVSGTNLITGIQDNNLISGGLFLSKNNGRSWLPIDTSFCFQFGYGISANGTNVFASNSWGGIILSHDEGMQWVNGNATFLGTVATCFAFSGNTIFAGTTIGIFISNDNGVNWKAADNTGLEVDNYGNTRVWSLTICDSNLFVGTDWGVFRRPLSQMVTGITNNGNQIPDNFSLKQNYPNPFNPTTTINYSIPKTSFVTIKVYDILGREVTTLINKNETAGNYSVNFNASSLSSGIYFYQLKAGDDVITRKMVFLK